MERTYEAAIALAHETFTEAEMWGQLAEEFDEAAQAALKMQRLHMPRNKPRKSAEACRDNLIEEMADIRNCLNILVAGGFEIPYQEIRDIGLAKMRRMVANIEAENEASEPVAAPRTCKTCKHHDISIYDMPCLVCYRIIDRPRWEAKELIRRCEE